MRREAVASGVAALLFAGAADAKIMDTWTRISIQFTNLARAEASDTGVGVTTLNTSGSGMHLNTISIGQGAQGAAPGLSLNTVLPVTDPIVSNGGIVSGDTGECASITSLGLTDAGRLPAPVAQALVTLKPGVVSEAITVNQDGWPPFVFLLHRPYAEIKDHLATAVAQDPVSAAKLGHLASARVSVASRFGRWDPISSSVLPQG